MRWALQLENEPHVRDTYATEDDALVAGEALLAGLPTSNRRRVVVYRMDEEVAS